MTWMMYGLKNCDTCRKARRWLDSQGVPYDFRDLREVPPTRALLQHWLEGLGADRMVNRRSTTWRGLSVAERTGAEAAAGLLDLVAANPALIKRPLFHRDARILAGFDTAVRAVLAGSGAPNQDGGPGAA